MHQYSSSACMAECKLDKEDEMAKIEPEKRASLTEVKKGKDVTELKFKMSINGEDMHYPGEMISGCKLMEKCIDCCTELKQHQRQWRWRTVRSYRRKHTHAGTYA